MLLVNGPLDLSRQLTGQAQIDLVPRLLLLELSKQLAELVVFDFKDLLLVLDNI